MESSHDAIIGQTLDGTITSWNRGAEQAYGYAAKKLIGRSITLIVPPEGTDEVGTILEAVRRGEHLNRLETARVKRGGPRIYGALTVSPVRDADGHVVAVSSIERDIMDRKLTEEAVQRSEARLRDQASKLAEANRRKNDFLALLGHELRNPLASIDNAVHLLRLRQQTHDAHAQWALQVIERQVKQLARLADDLLDIGRITSSKLKLEKAPLDLSEVVANAVETLRPDIEAHRHRLSVSLPSEPVGLYADAARLQQVLTNLLSNAIKYTADEGQIGLTVRQEDEHIAIVVQDTGIGIEPEILPHVFDRLSQSDRYAARSQGGLGLGLAIVRSLVEMHGGRVHATSAGPGRGSEFLVRLPASQPQVAAKTEKEAPEGLVATPFRILIVDDDADVANSLGTLLRIRGHDVKMVYDGVAALDMAQTFHPEVVFLDIGLPEMDGYEIAQRLRTAYSQRTLLLVALTGYEVDAARLRQAGFDQYLLKPATLQSVEALLSSWVPS